MDSSERLSSHLNGSFAKKGKKITFVLTSEKDLDVEFLKTEFCDLKIPELKWEHPSGRLLLKSFSDYFDETKIMIENSLRDASFVDSDFLSSYFEDTVKSGGKLTVVLTDPIGNSFVDSERASVANFERSLYDEIELGIRKPIPMDEPKTKSGEEGIEEFLKIVDSCSKIVVFTGAGVSCESGIPPFRGGKGFWDKYPMEKMVHQTIARDSSVQKLYWQMLRECYDFIKKAKPNPAHDLVSELHKRKKLLSCITQNFDGMHQVSGVPSSKTIELHGTLFEMVCIKCDKAYPFDPIMSKKAPSFCVKKECGGFIKPNVINFGQSLNDDVIVEAKKVLAECDCLILIGSSLIVAPANEIIWEPILKKKKLVMMNIGVTKFDKYMHVHFKGKCGEVSKKILEGLRFKKSR